LCLILHSESVCQMCLHCLVHICALSLQPKVRIRQQMKVVSSGAQYLSCAATVRAASTNCASINELAQLGALSTLERMDLVF